MLAAEPGRHGTQAWGISKGPLAEAIQAKRKGVIGRGNSIWKTWQEVQAPIQMPWNIAEEPKGRPVGAEGPREPGREVWIASSGNGKHGEPGSGEGHRGVLWGDLWEQNGWVIPAWVES